MSPAAHCRTTFFAIAGLSLAILLTVVPLASIPEVEVVDGHQVAAGEVLLRFRGAPHEQGAAGYFQEPAAFGRPQP
jgi:hypothetical protein